jgi:hypothetical protein
MDVAAPEFSAEYPTIRQANTVIPDAANGGDPESITPVLMMRRCGLWIPGSRFQRAPE